MLQVVREGFSEEVTCGYDLNKKKEPVKPGSGKNSPERGKSTCKFFKAGMSLESLGKLDADPGHGVCRDSTSAVYRHDVGLQTLPLNSCSSVTFYSNTEV